MLAPSMGKGPMHPVETRVWHAETDVFGTAERQRAFERLLDHGERSRLGRLRREGDRRAYLVAHALLRSALSAVVPIDPVLWRFRLGSHGKPEIQEPEEYRGLRFCLSHTRGRVACAVALGRDVGVDVEYSASVRSIAELVDHCLSPREAAALNALPARAQRARFFALWTLKEAYLKARGTGLTLPPAALSFDLGGGHPSVEFDQGLRDDPRGWQFALVEASPVHPIAVAIRRGDLPEVPFRILEARTIPFSR